MKVIIKMIKKKEKIQRKIREYEISLHSMKADFNRLLTKFQQNKNIIKYMEIERNILSEKYENKVNDLKKVNKKINEYKNINGSSGKLETNESINIRNIHEQNKNQNSVNINKKEYPKDINDINNNNINKNNKKRDYKYRKINKRNINIK